MTSVLWTDHPVCGIITASFGAQGSVEQAFQAVQIAD